MAGHVHQYAAGDDSIFEVDDTVVRGAFFRHYVLRITVIHLAVIEEVAKRVHVSMNVAVVGNKKRVAGAADARCGRSCSNSGHLANDGLRVVDGILEFRVVRHGEGYALLHQIHGLFSLLRRNEIDRAQLVVFPPAIPIGELRH